MRQPVDALGASQLLQDLRTLQGGQAPLQRVGSTLFAPQGGSTGAVAQQLAVSQPGAWPAIVERTGEPFQQ